MAETPQVTVIVGGKFHAFYLARELQRRRALARLITAYPRFAAVRAGIPPKKVAAFPAKEIALRTWQKLPAGPWKRRRPHYLLGEIFDRTASRALVPCDLLVGWSGFSLCSLEKMKKRGTPTVLERGSSHIAEQTDLLREEYRRFGLRPILADPRVVAKEIREYELADFIAIPSSFVRESFLRRGIPEEKLIQVPYGVELGDFHPRPGSRDEVFRVIYAGRICLRKGVHYLLRAFAELDLPGAELLLAGSVDADFRPFLAGIPDSVKLLGRRPQAELADIYSRGTVFVMPSIEEGMAMVQVQAMACALPLICTPNSGGSDLIREGEEGFTVGIRDVEALKERLRFLQRNRDRADEMGRRARQRVEGEFTWEKYGSRIFAEYLKVVRKGQQ